MLTAGGSHGKLVSERSRPGSARSAFHAMQAASTTAVWPPASTRWLSHRVLAGGYEAVVDAACAAWNALLAEPGRLRSLTSFPWLPASVTTS